MSPAQREAALRLAKALQNLGNEEEEAAALLLELAAEPVQEHQVAAAGMPATCQTQEGCRDHGCHGACLPVQEPIDCGEAGHAEKRCGNAACCAKPVAWMGLHDRTDLYYRKTSQVEVISLYAAPQQRKPLLASDIVTMYEECPRCDSDMIAFARAIEAAHGIKGTP